MVFSNLPPAEKEAFFGLLDEYFASRPDVVRALSANSSPNPEVINTSRPPARPAYNTSNDSSPNPEPAWKRQTQNRSPSPAQPPELPPSVGRVAAAAAAFRFNPGGQNAPTSAPPPRPPPRKLSSYESGTEQPEHEDAQVASNGRPLSTTGKLVAQRKFGDVDFSSGKNAYLSIRNGTANKHATPPSVAPPIPPAFPPKKNTFAPPPRRVSSASSQNDNASLKASSPPPPPPPRPRVEETQEGDWAEALYDYSSEDPGDLELQSGQRILVLERTSEDWWTGESQGRRGLLPAAYVRLL